MKVLVCGSRSWRDRRRIRARLLHLPRGSHVIHGGARGADRLAGDVARALGFQVEEVPAVWRTGGSVFDRSAGFRRNLRMLDMKPDLVIAFWDGRSTGTAHTIREAHKRGLAVEVHHPRPDRSS